MVWFFPAVFWPGQIVPSTFPTTLSQWRSGRGEIPGMKTLISRHTATDDMRFESQPRGGYGPKP